MGDALLFARGTAILSESLPEHFLLLDFGKLVTFGAWAIGGARAPSKKLIMENVGVCVKLARFQDHRYRHESRLNEVCGVSDTYFVENRIVQFACVRDVCYRDSLKLLSRPVAKRFIASPPAASTREESVAAGSLPSGSVTPPGA